VSAATPNRDVFVVDDDADIVEMLALILEGSGFRPIVVDDAYDALARLRAGPSPRVVLLDLRMPGMGGAEFRQAQLADPAIADVPVILLSGDPGVAQRADELGLPYLRKPVDIADLLAVVREPP